MPKYTVEGNMKDPEGIRRRRIIHNLGKLETSSTTAMMNETVNALQERHSVNVQ